MQEMTVVIFTADKEQQAVLRMQVDDTSVAKTAYTFTGFPMVTSDLNLRRAQEAGARVVLIEIPPNDPTPAIHAIDVVHTNMPEAAVFAIGDMNVPQVIVDAMRAGAREFIGRPVSNQKLLEAFVRISSLQRKADRQGPRGRVIAVVNAKGGSGATTIAVNLSLALRDRGSVLLVDLAPLGHAALHLNLEPSFTVHNAADSGNRLDSSLLDSFVAKHPSGLHLLAGAKQAHVHEISTSQLARLFDVLVNTYRHVVVDLSSRLDATARHICDLSAEVLVIAQADVTSLWSASKVQEFLAAGGSTAKTHLVLNRFRKIAGFSDADIERSTHVALLGKIPNHYPSVSTSIDRGTPIAQVNHSELARSFAALASSLHRGPSKSSDRLIPLFRTA
jgi:pilus assembly protein CpaE